MNIILKTAAGNPENQDRGAIIEFGERFVLVIADGAGGRSGGTEAAVMAVDFIRQQAWKLETAAACVELIQTLDRIIDQDRVAGETTCVIAVVTAGEIFGASVGDSGAWLMDEIGLLDLTGGQVRKPLVGSGNAHPVPFTRERTGAQRLLLATDGLLKYSSTDRITAICREGSPEEAASRLIDLVRFPSGNLPDDVTVIVAQLSRTGIATVRGAGILGAP